MELELVEPSLFLAHAPGGADRVAARDQHAGWGPATQGDAVADRAP